MGTLFRLSSPRRGQGRPRQRLTTWRKVYALYVAKAKGGEADKEAQARDQYYQFRGQVEQALTDLYRMENRLRYLMGLAATDGRLIRPINEPTTAKVVFDWCDVHGESLARSVYLRKEKWKIKQLELELIASRNLLLPNLDFVGNYELFGLGRQSAGQQLRSLQRPAGTIDHRHQCRLDACRWAIRKLEYRPAIQHADRSAREN